MSVRVSRVRVHRSDGRVTAEMLITTTAKGFSPILYPSSQINFSASRTRSSLVKELAASFPKWPWADIVDYLAQKVQELARIGEPLREGMTSDDIQKPAWLLEPILFRGLPSIIFGEKAVCKSTISLLLYMTLLLPWTDNDLGLGAPEQPVIPLLADYEVDYEVALWNLRRLVDGAGIAPIPLYYRRCSLPLADDTEQLQRHMEKIGASVLIVDSLGPAVGGDLKDPAEALRFTTALRQLRCSTLIIGQTSKDTESRNKHVFGSTFFEYYSRNIFELRKVQQDGEDDLDVGMFNTYNNLARKAKPFGWHIHFNEVATTVTTQDMAEVPEFESRRSGASRLLDGLKTGPANQKTLAEDLDLTIANVRMSLMRLRNKGLVTKLPGGNWALCQKT